MLEPQLFFSKSKQKPQISPPDPNFPFTSPNLALVLILFQSFSCIIVGVVSRVSVFRLTLYVLVVHIQGYILINMIVLVGSMLIIRDVYYILKKYFASRSDKH